MGGGTGAREINQSIEKIIPDLVKFCQIVHLTGFSEKNLGKFIHNHYHQVEFFEPRGFS